MSDETAPFAEKVKPTCTGCGGPLRVERALMTCDTADCPGNLRTKLAWGDPPCVFCQIASGKVPAQIADEAEGWTSFPPLGPHVPGHMLFVPRRHVADATVEPALTGTVFAAASAYLGRVLRSQGNLLTSVGPDATQTVMHLHVHVIPRGAGDGLHHDWPWMRDTRISPADATAEEARDA